MFIFGSSLLVLRCATALKSSLEVTSSWMSLAGYPANNVAFPGRMDPGRPRRATRGQPGEVVGMGHYCQLSVMAMSPGIPSGQSTIWTRSL